uniref:Uncharacterized protein n=1 Tax=uncultured prokaryote TaxID=198431 RepID=H5S975_9ZZZZ|nr:hypothetical protein HGMM_F03A04C34 [uncultured prokaryote]
MVKLPVDETGLSPKADKTLNVSSWIGLPSGSEIVPETGTISVAIIIVWTLAVVNRPDRVVTLTVIVHGVLVVKMGAVKVVGFAV